MTVIGYVCNRPPPPPLPQLSVKLRLRQEGKEGKKEGVKEGKKERQLYTVSTEGRSSRLGCFDSRYGNNVLKDVFKKIL